MSWTLAAPALHLHLADYSCRFAQLTENFFTVFTFTQHPSLVPLFYFQKSLVRGFCSPDILPSKSTLALGLVWIRHSTILPAIKSYLEIFQIYHTLSENVSLHFKKHCFYKKLRFYLFVKLKPQTRLIRYTVYSLMHTFHYPWKPIKFTAARKKVREFMWERWSKP